MEIKMKKFKHCFFGGYSTTDVNSYIFELDQKITKLESQVNDLITENSSLHSKVYKFQDRENSINEVLVDAKLMAKNIIQNAENQAHNITNELKQNADARLNEFENSIQRLTEAEAIMRRQGDRLKAELKGVLRGYLKEIESLDMSGFSEIQEEVTEKISMAEELVRQSKTMITFPKLSTNSSTSSNSNTSVQEGDNIPTYKIKFN